MISDVNSIHGFFVTYKQLVEENRIFANIDKWANCSNIDIYIDMNSATKELFYNKPLVNGGAEVASTLLNLCGHYREYYRKFHQCETRFFIIYSINRPKNCVDIFDEYNSPNIMKQMRDPIIYDMITKACSYLDEICKYIPDVFFIYSDYETSVTIYDSIDFRQQKPYPSLIISKDPLTCSVVAFSDNCLILRPHKSMVSGGNYKIDKSYFIKQKEIMPHIIHEYTNKNLPIYRELSPKFIPVIFSLCGLKKRNISKLLNINEAVTSIYNGIQDGSIVNGYNHIELLYDALRIEFFGVSKKEIFDRYVMMDMITQHNTMVNELSLGVDEYDFKVVNVEDPERVHFLNNTEFKNCPIYLDRL